MCRTGFLTLIIVFVLSLLWLFVLLDVLQAEDWYLITETELQGIEQYKAKSEAERQSWLLQVQNLRGKAENSEAKSARLEMESESLNTQLSQAKEQNRRLEKSFGEYEAALLALISSMNGEIEAWKQEASKQTLRTAKAEGKSTRHLIIIITLTAGIVIYTGIKVYRRFRL